MFTENYEDYAGFFTGERGPFRGRPGPFRAGRGMMEPAILSALAERPMHGYEIISYLEEKSHGIWRPSPGSVYPTLQLLEEKELVKYIEQDDKKTYELTKAGKKEVETGHDHLSAIFERFGGEDQREGRRMNWRHDYQRQFHMDVADIIKTMRRVFRKGSSQQKDAMAMAVADFKAHLGAIEKGEL